MHLDFDLTFPVREPFTSSPFYRSRCPSVKHSLPLPSQPLPIDRTLEETLMYSCNVCFPPLNSKCFWTPFFSLPPLNSVFPSSRFHQKKIFNFPCLFLDLSLPRCFCFPVRKGPLRNCIRTFPFFSLLSGPSVERPVYKPRISPSPLARALSFPPRRTAYSARFPLMKCFFVLRHILSTPTATALGLLKAAPLFSDFTLKASTPRYFPHFPVRELSAMTASYLPPVTLVFPFLWPTSVPSLCSIFLRQALSPYCMRTRSTSLFRDYSLPSIVAPPPALSQDFRSVINFIQ